MIQTLPGEKKMTIPPEVVNLVERFERNLDAYRRPDYKETRVRVEFIDPFFEALGWDVHNVQGHAEQYKDVVHEDAIQVSGATRAPDYCFRVGGTRKFFLEVKKPAVWIKEDVGPAYQLRRYAWSAKLPLSILTDFEEFAVYDCRQRPKPTDKVSVGRIMYLTFDQYPDRFDDIYGVFAKESVWQGSFDRYVQDTRGKRGTSEVDAEFLKEIEGWREALAHNIALRNPDLSVHELNFSVQRTIDRIIFLRMCEDRGIEGYGRLLALTGGPHIYARMGDLYRQADEKYNSELFDFQADTLSKTLAVDDKVLNPILAGLYYPQSPYEFSVLPTEILGQVYEQFLGKVIRLTPGHRAKVEEKPEVKKAGGVYYTPTYIVDYIVQQTVGKLVEGKTPRQISKLRVLDPACGSGSFLLGAYQYLLDYHRQWYEAHDPAKHARGKRPAVYQTPSPTLPLLEGGQDGSWRLTTAEKKRILLNNIYGVDIDRQAVEVTKLSLLLKVLEGESQETLGQQLMLWRERALPDLGDNIKCGNSLIGPDYFEAQLMPDEEEMRRVNAFDWEAGFPEVMARGGFDCVISNPPYIRIQTMKEWVPTEVEFYKRYYAAASKGNYDIYVIFVERALQLLNDRGRMGYILTHKFFQAKYGQPLRELISGGKHLAEIVHFGAQQVFAGATTYTCLLFLDKGGNKRFRYVKARDLDAWRASGEAIEGEIRADKVTEKEWNFVVGPGAPLFERLSEMPVKLGDVAERVFQGIIPGMDAVYSVELIEEGPEATKCYSRALSKEILIECSILRKIASGSQVKPYIIEDDGSRVIYPYEFVEGTCILIAPDKMKRDFPLAYEYFQQTRDLLNKRDRGSAKGPQWYRYIRTQNIGLQAFAKLAVPRLVRRLCAAYDADAEFCLDNVDVGGVLLPAEGLAGYHYLLGLLNSKLLDFYFRNNSVPFRGDFFSANRQYIEQLPIHTINFDDPADVARHDKMVALVERMLALHRKLAAATIPADKELYRRQIEATDRQIDGLVYELYGLREEEIEVVERRGA
jgi:hypothetical protein